MKEHYRRLMQGFVASRPEDPAPDDLLEAVRGLPEVGQLPPPSVTWTLVQLVGRLGSNSMETISERERAAASGAGSQEPETNASRPDAEYPLFKVDLRDEWEEHSRYGYSFRHCAPGARSDHGWDPIGDSKTGRLPFVFVPEFMVGSVYCYTIDPVLPFLSARPVK